MCMEETSEIVALPSSASRQSTESWDCSRACGVPREAQESHDLEGNASPQYKRSESPPWCSSSHPVKTARREYADSKLDPGPHTD